MNLALIEPALVCYDYDGYDAGNVDIYEMFHHLERHLEFLAAHGLKLGMPTEYHTAIMQSFPWARMQEFNDINLIFQRYLQTLAGDFPFPDETTAPEWETVTCDPDLAIPFGPDCVRQSWRAMLWGICALRCPGIADAVIGTQKRLALGEATAVALNCLDGETPRHATLDLVFDDSDWHRRCLEWIIQSMDSGNAPLPVKRNDSTPVEIKVASKAHHRPRGWESVRGRLASSPYVCRVEEIELTSAATERVEAKGGADDLSIEVLAPVSGGKALKWRVRTTAETLAQNIWVARKLQIAILD